MTATGIGSVTRLKEWPKTGQDGKTPGGRVIGSASRSEAAPDPDSPEGLVSGTVADVEARLEDIADEDGLDAIAAAEKAGKDRVGVHEAIERRRAALGADGS